MYRKNVGIVVFNKDKKVLMCARNDKKTAHWQFPQGGIDAGETPLEAAYRELKEETGITSVQFVFITENSFKYEFPDKIKGRDHIGQDQFWTLFYFTGDDAEIDINGDNPEFSNFEWTDIISAPNKIVAFKQNVYKQMVSIFMPLIEDYHA